MSDEVRPFREPVLAGDSIRVSAEGRIKRVYDTQGNHYTEQGDGSWVAVNCSPLLPGQDHIPIVRDGGF